MESILFSLNSVMPLFLMGIAGYLLVQRGVVNENFVDQASNLCFKLLIPFSLFREVYDAKVLDSFDFRLPLYCVLSVLTVLILAWLIWPHFVKDRARCGACIHSTFRANVVLMGIPVLTNMYGEEGALVAAMALPFVVILSNIGAVTVFTAFAPESSGARLDPRKLLLSIAKNPFIIAILLGLAAQLSGDFLPALCLQIHRLSGGYVHTAGTAGSGRSVRPQEGCGQPAAQPDYLHPASGGDPRGSDRRGSCPGLPGPGTGVHLCGSWLAVGSIRCGLLPR